MTGGRLLGPDTVARVTLANGIVLMVYPNPSSPSVAIAAQHAAGAILESEDPIAAWRASPPTA